MKKRWSSFVRFVALVIVSAVIAGCGGNGGSNPGPPPIITQGPLDQFSLSGDVQAVHDPAVVHANNSYYLFSTDTLPGGHLQIRTSTDGKTWHFAGFIFSSIPAWVAQKIPGIQDLWAPDISFFDGKYHVYYAGSTFGSQHSVIGLVTNVTLDAASPDYQWIDEGEVMESNIGDDFNAIDPNILVDSDGSIWITYGSYWTGIKQRRIELGTGKLSAADAAIHSLASRPGNTALEAPVLVHHANYYYLFVSFDHCCQGATSDYRIMVGRATSPNGPFVDRNGTDMMVGGATQVLAGNSKWAGPGGQTVYLSVTGDVIVFHAYDKGYASGNGAPYLHVNSIAWTSDWPEIK
jgi:arabinan endo-1,5-alpha-L-arabinosidase